MGVSGSGKTTVGRQLAAHLGVEFLDADDFHSLENVAKMKAGTPLTDADRTGWLARLRSQIENHLAAGRPAVLACSALREAYRETLHQHDERIHVVFLRGDFAAIQKRLAARRGHYMPATLLASQFAALEEPRDAITVSIELPPEEAVLEIVRELGFHAPLVPRERESSTSRPDGP